jgi:hypothetical protein
MKDDAATSLQDGPAPGRRLDLEDRIDSIERLQRMHHAEVCTRLDAIITRLAPVVVEQRDLRAEVDQQARDLIEHRARLSKLDELAAQRLKKAKKK